MKERSVKVAYFGAAAFKITTATGKKILVDPYIGDNPLCTQDLEYFYDADLILVSHGAFDHLGDTVALMKGSTADLLCGPEVQQHCCELGVPKERIKITVSGDEKDYDGIHIKTVHARHISRFQSGTQIYSGEPMGFVISTENNIRIYHMGDTSLFGDLKLIGMLYRPHILLIGISKVAEGYPSEMNPREAALATLWVGPEVVIPTHYPPGSDEPAKFSQAVKVIAPNVVPIILEANSEITYGKYDEIRVGPLT